MFKNEISREAHKCEPIAQGGHEVGDYPSQFEDHLVWGAERALSGGVTVVLPTDPQERDELNARINAALAAVKVPTSNRVA